MVSNQEVPEYDDGRRGMIESGNASDPEEGVPVLPMRRSESDLEGGVPVHRTRRNDLGTSE